MIYKIPAEIPNCKNSTHQFCFIFELIKKVNFQQKDAVKNSMEPIAAADHFTKLEIKFLCV
jgi:hypothetical protein